MPGGRPSKYKKEYCQSLVKLMAQGYSFEAFAAEVGVHIDTLHAWSAQFPEFSEAKKIGKAKSLKFWEEKGINNLIMAGGDDAPKFNTTLWIFNMKNRFGWRDKQPDEVSNNPQVLLEAVNKAVAQMEASQVGKSSAPRALSGAGKT